MYKGSKVILIAAYAANRLIGDKQGNIPWKNDPDCTGLVENDISRLRLMIKGSAVIVGRKTYEDISEIPRDPIKHNWNAQVIVMSRDPNYQVQHEIAMNAVSLDDALSRVIDAPICVLGGAEIYSEFLNREGLVDLMELTVIDRDYSSDGCCFPNFALNDWRMSNCEEKGVDAKVRYRFLTYQRR